MPTIEVSKAEIEKVAAKKEALGYKVFSDVEYAIEVLLYRFGAQDHRSSNHKMGAGGRPTWIFEFPHFAAEVGVPMNKTQLTLYLRNRTLDGRRLTEILPVQKVISVYPRDGDPAQSIKDSRYLGASSGDEVVMLRLDRSDVLAVFDTFFGMTSVSATAVLDASTNGSAPPALAMAASNQKRPPPMSAEDFNTMLERRSEVGQAGELVAVRDELNRLSQLGCPDPHRWVQRVALVDVGRGYDIESSWPGQERFIEVKSSTSLKNALYISDNERRVLGHLGSQAWIYRVVVGPLGGAQGEVTARLQNPMSSLTDTDFVPVVFRVTAESISTALAKGKIQDE